MPFVSDDFLIRRIFIRFTFDLIIITMKASKILNNKELCSRKIKREINQNVIKRN